MNYLNNFFFALGCCLSEMSLLGIEGRGTDSAKQKYRENKALLF